MSELAEETKSPTIQPAKFTYACDWVYEGWHIDWADLLKVGERARFELCLEACDDETHAMAAESAASYFCGDDQDECDDAWSVAVLCLETGARWIVSTAGHMGITWSSVEKPVKP